MQREEKTKVVSELADALSRSAIIISTNYQGMRGKQMTELRHTLANANIEYRVVKNTLVYSAADDAGMMRLMQIIEGPVGLAFGYDEIANTARILNQYIKSASSPLRIRGGLLGDRVLAPEEVVGLANLPSMDILVSSLIGQLQTPVARLHNVLAAPMRGLIYVLQNMAQQAKQ